MPYQPTKPQPPDDLDVSVTDIQQNFLISNTVMAIDHYPFDNATANKGQHKQSTYPNQGAAPTTAVGELALYSKLGAVSSELFMIRDNNSGTEVALTTSKIGNATAATNGVSWLPGGIIVQWGFVNSNVQNTNTAQAFNVAFPTACFNVQSTLVAAVADPTTTGTIMIKSVVPGSFTWRFVASSGSYSGFYWYAVGN